MNQHQNTDDGERIEERFRTKKKLRINEAMFKSVKVEKAVKKSKKKN